MLDRADPIGTLQRQSLVSGYRDKARFRKCLDDLRQAGKVEPAVHGCQKRDAQPTEQRKVKPVDMGVDHVEIARPSRDRFQQERTGSTRIGALLSEAQSARPNRVKLAACF